MWIVRRLLKAILIVVAAIVAIPILGLAYGYVATNAPPLASEATAPAGDAEVAARIRREVSGYQRPEESTYLTYPEWSIVYAARDYRDLVATRSPSDFAYWGSIASYWRDYATVIRATSSYPFNANNHLMLVVIGTSHTIENAVQSVYENTIGRLTGLWFPSDEDRYQAAVAADYASFLDQVPWYRFDYRGKRAGLWGQQSETGLAAIRSWERKLGFGLSYTIKQAYADVIASGLSATQDPAALEIHVWAQGPVAEAIAGEPNTRPVLDLGQNGLVFVTERYQRFTELVPRLIDKGVRLVEIGGNDDIFVTVLTPDPLTPFDGARTLFAGAVAGRTDLVRTGLSIRVGSLATVLPELAKAGATLEHLYDY